MKRHLRLLIQYFAQYSMVRLAYKADFFIAFATSMTATILGFGFMLVLFTKIPSLQGWSFYEVMFLYGFSLIPLGFFNVLSWNLHDFSNLYIIQGRFDRVLLRPVPFSVFRFFLRSSALNPCRRWSREQRSYGSAPRSWRSFGASRTWHGFW